ncbi:hypothetical protein [Streptomyces glycanivorans]|jgi:hypothetical protein|uniref:SCP domain-containing protein n=1 Tax=Streptomyces glycanivorans TaxID=3033808 RepID=A0ABY9JNJ7_9ACTN|nr:hypothetical protein [Streptomyces sp. Alt3]WLQ69287.1 hypothetical protein P8A20_37835 [Streptomyces sp. Alt3]
MTISTTRAKAIFGRNDGGGVDWPYGVGATIPNPTWSPEQRRAHLQDREEAKQIVFDWAEKHGLRKTDNGCCPVWLQQNRNSRCGGPRTCARFGSGGWDTGWMDHTATWTFDRRPAAITSAPYRIRQSDRDELNRWVAADPRLAIAYGNTGWYGLDTYQIILWRTDLVEVIEPA